jgi:Ser/Thr protein kinase RdoA (MazF antagonist)
MANVEGEFLLALDAPEGERLAVLTPFLPGRLLRERPDSEAIRAFGQVIARIHRAADEAPLEAWERPKVDARDQIEAALDAFRRELPDLKQEGRTLQACAARLLPLLELDVGTTPEYGMIHGDVIRANALVDDDGGVSVLDLDFCGPGWRAYDVASFLSVIRGEAYEAKAERAFLEGYAAVRLLTPHERRVLPVFEAASAMHSLGVSARYAGFWGRAYVDAYLPMKMARLARAMERLPQR